ncbi:MAG TPA: MMPL family transporter [Solirubrobacterales bacterium]|nr:MMPL family transporter [Solirubrobacterales bacterium]
MSEARGEKAELGPIGRLGRAAALRPRRVFAAWALIAVGLGVLAPRVETALSGAGWQANGSESVEARERIDRTFAGGGAYTLQVVVHSPDLPASAPAFRSSLARVEAVLAADRAVASVMPPRPGLTVSPDRHTAVVRATAAEDPNGMVAAATDLKGPVAAAAGPGVEANLTGTAGMWSDFNEANKEAMLKSELLSWPVTLAILVLAFGSLVAAGLPLMLTIVGLVSSAGLLYLGTKIGPISIWAMNFALMFALALGIDYALFIVMRFRNALFGQRREPAEAVAETMDTAGKAVLFSGLTVLISLIAVMLVPSPAFRSMSVGIILSVVFVLAATLTLLPAVLGKLGPRIDSLALPWAHSGDHRSPRFARWGERLWRRPLLFGGGALLVLAGLSVPVLGLKTGMPSIVVVPQGDHSRVGYEQISAAFGPGAPGAIQVVSPGADSGEVRATLEADPGIAATLPGSRSPSAGPPAGQSPSGEPPAGQSPSGGLVLTQAIPTASPSSAAFGSTIERLRKRLPEAALLGGAAAENYDLEKALDARTPVAIGVVLALGFLLLLVAFQAPLLAAIGVLTNLLATGAAFGVATLIFQDGHLSGLLGFESQGFLDAWGPVFFFAMIFAIAMDYTVFLLSSAREHWEASGDPREAMVSGLAHSGRVVLAAGAVMVAVFFTFALSGPLPPKEMGVILGVAVLLDAFLVRLTLLPVALRLAGAAAWYIPAWLRRLLPEIRFGHGAVGPGPHHDAAKAAPPVATESSV